MRLLFDQNLSFILCQMIADLFPDSSHVRSHGLSEAADRALWEFAKANGFAIVTQDVDFADMASLLGSPPKVIWLRTGNQTTAAIAALLRRHAQTIESFESDNGTACLEIY
ncbi:putative nuclease of putative toxin-antitoxin system [Bradyrhizobium sp. LM6.10]